MVLQLKELSEDEKIRQQCQAREDYERRLIGEYNRGQRDGELRGIQQGMKRGIEQGKTVLRDSLVNLARANKLAIEDAAETLEITVEEFKKMMEQENV